LVSGFVVLILATVISLSAGFFDLSDGNNRDYMIWEDPMTIDMDKQVAGREYVKAALAEDPLPIRL
jgi:hypothetical protein